MPVRLVAVSKWSDSWSDLRPSGASCEKTMGRGGGYGSWPSGKLHIMLINVGISSSDSGCGGSNEAYVSL